MITTGIFVDTWEVTKSAGANVNPARLEVKTRQKFVEIHNFDVEFFVDFHLISRIKW